MYSIAQLELQRTPYIIAQIQRWKVGILAPVLPRTTAWSGCLGWVAHCHRPKLPAEGDTLSPGAMWGSFSLQVVKVPQPAGERGRGCFSAEKLPVALHTHGKHITTVPLKHSGFQPGGINRLIKVDQDRRKHPHLISNMADSSPHPYLTSRRCFPKASKSSFTILLLMLDNCFVSSSTCTQC